MVNKYKREQIKKIGKTIRRQGFLVEQHARRCI